MSLLTMSCNRPAGVKAVAYSDISYEEIEEATRLALSNESIEVSTYSNYILKILIQAYHFIAKRITRNTNIFRK